MYQATKITQKEILFLVLFLFVGMGKVAADDIEFFVLRYWDRRKFIYFATGVLMTFLLEISITPCNYHHVSIPLGVICVGGLAMELYIISIWNI